MAVMILQGCNSTPQKSRPVESGHGRRAVQVANVCSFLAGLKNEFQFLCELGWFLHGQSHITTFCKQISLLYRSIYVTGFAKTILKGTFCISRNINLKY